MIADTNPEWVSNQTLARSSYFLVYPLNSKEMTRLKMMRPRPESTEQLTSPRSQIIWDEEVHDN